MTKRIETSKRFLTVASYNIHAALGTDKRYAPSRIARIIRDIAPDIVGLQEVDAGYWTLRSKKQLHELAEATGMIPIAGPTLVREDTSYGNAILTRHKAESIEQIDISIRAREQRGAIDARFDIEGKAVRVVAAHLGLKRKERLRQAEKLVKHIQAKKAHRTILMGDFNEWFPFANLFRLLDDAFGSTQKIRSFPARFPILPLDVLRVMPAETCLNVETYRHPKAKRASDHLPLVAKIAL